MANFYFTDADGMKQGPLTPPQLQALAKRGIIMPDTILTTDAGQQGKAGQIRGLFPIAPSPSVQPAQVPQKVTVPVVEKSGGASWQVTLIGVVLISVVGGIGWSIINNQQPAPTNNAPAPPIENVQVLAENNVPVVPIEVAQNSNVPVDAPNQPNQPAPNPPQVQAPKPTASNQANVLSSPAGIKLGKQIDYVLQNKEDGSKKVMVFTPITNDEKTR